MKFAFSTLGCPGWTFDEILTTAKDLGFDGVEVRGVGEELYAPKIEAFSVTCSGVEAGGWERINATKAKLKRLGMQISMLTSGACMAMSRSGSGAVAPRPAADAVGSLASLTGSGAVAPCPAANAVGSLKEGFEYVDTARRLSVEFVRVMCTDKPGLDDRGSYELAVKNYRKLCLYAAGTGVTPLIETNGMFCDTALLRRFMEEVGTDNSGVLWDIHHPYRFGRETIHTTVVNIGKYIKYAHIKDSVIDKDGNVVYKMLGQGDIPVKTAFAALKKLGFDGYVSLEWVKRWDKTLEDAGIVFAHFIEFVNGIAGKD